jgi:superfamily I DNA/RNA helicase
MPFEAYLTAAFQHRHENDMFAALVKNLMAKFASDTAPHVLVGNIMFEGNDLDVLYMKPDGICIIEMKAHGGKVNFTESTPWIVGTSEVRGGGRMNPFLQVRAYRLGLINFFRNRGKEILKRDRLVRWDHVSGVVLFGNSIQFDDRVLGGLRTWFGITDQSRVADHLANIHQETFGLDWTEIRAVLDLVGLDQRYLYKTSVVGAGTPLQASPPRVLKPLQLVYLKEFAFSQRRELVSNRGGAQSQAAQTVRELLELVRQGLNPFTTMASRKDSRIKGATLYSINASCDLLFIENEASVFPAFMGSETEVQGWLAAHEGLVVTVDTATGRYAVTRNMGESDTKKMQPPALTTEIKPLLTQIAGLELENLVPARKLREILLQIDEGSTEDEIRDTLEMIADNDIRTFLFDLINLIRSGDHRGAEARLSLRLGKVVPVDDAGGFAQDAAGSGANSDQAKVINELSKEELDRLLDPKHFKDWMLFLHPDQKSLAETEFDRPVVLTGVSGSGKTCVLVHRARHLARKYPGQKIGILTLSRDLAGLLQNLVNILLTEEERRVVTVHTFYDVFRACLKHLGPDKYFTQLGDQVDAGSHLHTVLAQAEEKWPDRMVWNCEPIGNVRVEDEWEEFYMSRNPGMRDCMNGIVKDLEDSTVDASRYLEEEFTLIRSQFVVPSRVNYLNTEDRKIRAGRVIPFRKEMRQDVLRLLLFWEEWLLAGGMIDDLGLTQALMPLHIEMQQLPDELKFRCLLADEFQDFSTLDLQLFRRIVPINEPDALFVCGDMVQKILVKRQSLQDAALVQGPAIKKSILKNYRNSKQVLRAASCLANYYGALANSQDEEIEVLDPELAQRDSNPPIVLKTDDQITKAWEIALECTQGNKTEPWTVCIATASPQKFSIPAILSQRPVTLAARSLSGDCILHPEEVVVGTISQLKGFEFRLVLIIGCDEGKFPETGVPHDEVWRDALRLYVAMTRGQDQVYLMHGEKRSEFISVFENTVVYREEPVLKPYEKIKTTLLNSGVAKPPVLKKPGKYPVSQSIKRGIRDLDSDGRCEGWFSEQELEVLHRYFARHVYRDGLTFREWLRPEALKTITPSIFYKVPRCTPTIISAVLTKLKTHGIELTRREETFRGKRPQNPPR